jgi:predicted nucleic acid-binding Zn ribbon protein
MKHPEFIVRKGRTYKLVPSGIYYRDQNRNGVKERLLHRVIWTENNGPIPKGLCVHHKDHDPSNNSISNLTLASMSEHNSLHARERMSDPAKLEIQRRYMEKAIRANWLKRKRHQSTCQVCGKEFMTYFPMKAKYCSKSCFNKHCVKTYRSDDRHCVVCGKTFECYRYASTRHCSTACAVKTTSELKKLHRAGELTSV